ncbi:DUF3137 domain-containing protein [Mycoplasma marinum]|uniref:DUF3137 domain-containing protein n=1 Tax=Mycoplasma marinum TaxID=1937190 RepID=A0A4R0XWI8_9MOLU|nr:DUF3137 domain-containing protein [Mycoplasma marinum]TCG11341.1 hypothetical protein C4B24_02200 [Mycoplasma marinum]
MKKVEPILTREEYKRKIEEPLRKEITDAVTSCQDVVNKKLKSVAQTWYKVTKIALIVIGTIMIIIGMFTGGGAALIALAGLGLIAIIVGIIMFYYSSVKYKGVDEIYRESMDLEKIYKTAIGGLPDFEYVSNENVISKNLIRHTYKIPNDAVIKNASNHFKVTFKSKYLITFQSGLFHWVRYSTDSKGNRTRQDYYRDSGFASVHFDKSESDHEFTMHRKNWFSNTQIDKIELENRDFMKKTKFKSNNEIKARMMFTPLAMEEVLKLQKNMKLSFDLVKKGNVANFSYGSVKNQFIIDAKAAKTIDETVNRYFNDIIEDFYYLYEILGSVTIPPVL